MKINFTLLVSLLFLADAFGQDTIDVVEKTIKIGPVSTETEYYGFAEGDKVIFSLSVDFGKELKDITVSEYPQSVKFADHTVQKVENKILNIARKEIYVFSYYNSNVSGRTVRIKIQRIPKSDATKFFNTNVKWVTRVDTTYEAREKTYLIKSDTSFIDVADSKVRVHSMTNAEPNKTIVDFTLPSNTIKWSYWIGVGDESQKAFERDQQKFASMGAKLIGTLNPLAGVAFGLFTMTQVNIGDNVKYYFFPSFEDAQKYLRGQPFLQFKQGNVVSDFGLMNYSNKGNAKYYIGLENDNIRDGINVNVKILAVKVYNKYNTVVEKIPIYRNMTGPVNEN